MEFGTHFYPTGLSGLMLTRRDYLLCKGNPSDLRQKLMDIYFILYCRFPRSSVPKIPWLFTSLRSMLSSVECHAADRHFPAELSGIKDQDLILPASNQSRRSICPHDTITKTMSLALLLTRALLFTLGLSAMPSNHRFFFVCSPYFPHLSPHSSSPHLYLRHAAVWSVTCKARTELEINYSGALACLVTPLISSIRIDRCLSSMRPEGMPFLPETARPRFGL